MTARSLIISSPHFKRSLTCSPSYSRPMTGVKSWFLKLSRVPVYFKGFVRRVRAWTLPPNNWPSSSCSFAGNSTEGMVMLDLVYFLIGRILQERVSLSADPHKYRAVAQISTVRDFT